MVGITATMLIKCLRELEQDKFITRTQYRADRPDHEKDHRRHDLHRGGALFRDEQGNDVGQDMPYD